MDEKTYMTIDEKTAEEIDNKMPDESELYDLADLFKVLEIRPELKFSMFCLRMRCVFMTSHLF